MRSSTDYRCRSWWGVVVVAVLMASGCGTTTRRGIETSADTVEDGGPSDLSAGQDEQLGDQTATGGGDAAGSSEPTRGGARAPSRAASPGAPAGDSSPRAPAEDGKPVELGIYLYDSESAAAVSAGFGGSTDFGDGRRMAEIFVEHMNETGGIRGHPIEPIIYEADLARNADVNDQEGCDLFTQDHYVVAVVSNNWNTNEVMLKCLAERNVPLYEGGLSSYSNWTRESYSRYPLFANSGLSWDRLAGPHVDNLVAMDYFSGWDTTSGAPGSAEVRIGAMGPDDEKGHEVIELLESALARHGYRFHAKAFYPQGNVPAAAREMPNYVLRFRSEGITHVFINSLGQALLFMSHAESQGYRPRYGLTTRSSPLGLSGGAVPDAQLEGSLGSGWAPLADAPPARRPDPPPTEAACMKMMTDGGEDMSGDNARLQASSICEAGWAHRAAFEAGGGFTPQHWLAGLESLGASVVSVQAFAVFYGPGRHDAIAAMRGIAYRESCSCFEYTSGNVIV